MRRLALAMVLVCLTGCWTAKKAEDGGALDSEAGSADTRVVDRAIDRSPDQTPPPRTCASRTWGWTSAASMETARKHHSATRLLDGRVLVVGGQGDTTSTNTAYLTSAELYDPALDKWSPAGTLSVGRHTQPAVLLGDGRVLIAGGYRFGASATAELYDGTWRTAASMNVDRYGHALILLPSGEVLAAGGYSDATDGYQASAEIYAPKTDQWKLIAPMPAPRHAGYAATLRAGAKQGQILFAGGSDGKPLASAVIFDPLTMKWDTAAPMTASRQEELGGHPAAAALKDGRVLIAGETEGTAAPGSATLFDATLGWSDAPPMSVPRRVGTLTVLADDTAVAVGGWSTVASIEDKTTEAFDASVGQWLPRGELAQPRLAHSATALLDGSLLVCGGHTGGAVTTSCERLKERGIVAVNDGALPAGGGEALGTPERSAVGNSWRATCDVSVAAIRLALFTEGSAVTDGVEVKVFAHGGTPERPETGKLLGTSKTVEAAWMRAGSRWVGFTFSPPIAVASGQSYYWVAYRTGAADAANYYRIASNQGQYQDGERWDRTGGIWAVDKTSDYRFQIESD
jgi:hypothetical protein